MSKPKSKPEVSKERELDQFYTNPTYAKQFISTVDTTIGFSNYDLLVEPSAGDGSFLLNLDETKRIGIDIDPQHNEIIKHDFLTWEYPTDIKTLSIGNPPFGKNSTLAIKFFNQAAQFSAAIAFVVPRTFRKASVINRLDVHFELIHDETVPDNSFIFNGKPYNVTCCSQIWVKQDAKREKITVYKMQQVSAYFEIVDVNDSNFSLQRVGGKAGLIRTDGYHHLSKLSNYFIKMHFDFVLDVFKQIDFDEVRTNTAGNPSISPSELVEMWVSKATELGHSIVLKSLDKDQTQ